MQGLLRHRRLVDVVLGQLLGLVLLVVRMLRVDGSWVIIWTVLLGLVHDHRLPIALLYSESRLQFLGIVISFPVPFPLLSSSLSLWAAAICL